MLYYTPWCGFCLRFAHLYLLLAFQFRAVDSIVFARYGGGLSIAVSCILHVEQCDDDGCRYKKHTQFTLVLNLYQHVGQIFHTLYTQLKGLCKLKQLTCHSLP